MEEPLPAQEIIKKNKYVQCAFAFIPRNYQIVCFEAVCFRLQIHQKLSPFYPEIYKRKILREKVRKHAFGQEKKGFKKKGRKKLTTMNKKRKRPR